MCSCIHDIGVCYNNILSFFYHVLCIGAPACYLLSLGSSPGTYPVVGVPYLCNQNIHLYAWALICMYMYLGT